MFHAIKAFTVHKTLETRSLSKKFFKNESFFLFSLKCFDLNSTPRIYTVIYIAEHHIHCRASLVKLLPLFSNKEGIFSVKFIEIMRFPKLLQVKIEISSYISSLKMH